MKHQQRSPASPSGEESNPAPFFAPVNPAIQIPKEDVSRLEILLSRSYILGSLVTLSH